MHCVHHGRQQLASEMLEWIPSGEGEMGEERELDGWTECMLQ